MKSQLKELNKLNIEIVSEGILGLVNIFVALILYKFNLINWHQCLIYGIIICILISLCMLITALLEI